MMLVGTVADSASAISAAFAAIAAIASWVAVSQTRKQFKATRRPDLEISEITGLDTGQVKIHIRNHGQGGARNVKFAVVHGAEAAYGFLPPDATLGPGASRTLLTPFGPDGDKESVAVVICNDGEGQVHAWKGSGEHKQWKLGRPWNHDLSDQKIFAGFYPDVDLLARTLVRYSVE